MRFRPCWMSVIGCSATGTFRASAERRAIEEKEFQNHMGKVAKARFATCCPGRWPGIVLWKRRQSRRKTWNSCRWSRLTWPMHFKRPMRPCKTPSSGSALPRPMQGRKRKAAEREKVREQLKAEMYEARKDRRTVSEVKTDLDSSAPEACSAQESEELSGMSQHGSDLEAPPKPSEQDQLSQLSQPFVPKPPSRDQASARPPRWKVVGGVGKGGIIVRQERDLQSEQLTERLSTGAIVEEIELFGDRLHYSRLSGTGPQTGWVSLRMARKELLIPVKPPARPARPLLGQAPGRPARPEWRHWHSEELPFTQMEPPIRSSSAQSERCERKPTSLPRLPQPKSAPPPRTRPDLTLPPLPPLLPNGKPIHQAM
ncbi:unnamed protein product [Durusdinium trenchii]|uniref:SH3 domain-containing protein n=1 Tax=Durusdinium trenchii TaxID=1381693 RepID=A0ABP0P837_9DINO